MRIRSIKPDFWRSSSISSLPLEDRLLFIGLWSYVDDNGVGRDKLSAIAADLFADDLEADSRETFARVSRGLSKLFEAGRITRYAVENVDYLAISNWEEHQRIDKPAKPRYPSLTRDDAVIRETVATPSRDSRETLAPGAGEQGNRGTEEKVKDLVADATDSDFAEWYSTYPKKVARPAALSAYKRARKKTAAPVLLAGAVVMAKAYSRDKKFCPNPATWLNQERWADDSDAVSVDPRSDRQRETDDLFDRAMDRARAHDAETERKAIA